MNVFLIKVDSSNSHPQTSSAVVSSHSKSIQHQKNFASKDLDGPFLSNYLTFYINMHILVYFHTSILPCFHTSILPYFHASILAYMCIHAYLHICAYLHMCILAYLHTCILAYRVIRFRIQNLTKIREELSEI